MRICILISSADQLQQAGVRIRYQRIQPILHELGHVLEFVNIDDAAERHIRNYDVYVVSKCYEASALLVAHLLSGHDKLFGIDVFDDYFSQTHDSRFLKQRLWLRSLMSLVDFALTSTGEMATVVRTFSSGKPIHVMNDPSPHLDANDLKSRLRQKLEYFQDTKTLNVGWFGIGDNPYFPVGIEDLAAFGSELSPLRANGAHVHLDVLTNTRAMTPDNLAMLCRLPLPYSVEEWTEDREARLLRKSLVIFLPVNAQNFSVAKSLNRAMTALSAGAQVLSSGYPLYQALSAFIYRTPTELSADLQSGALALNEQNVPALLNSMEQLGSPDREAKRLLNFLDSQFRSKVDRKNGTATRAFSAVIHGDDSPAAVHRLAQKIGAISIASPYASNKLNYDVIFSFSTEYPYLDVFVADRCLGQLGQDVQSILNPYGRKLDRTYQITDIGSLLPDFSFPEGASASRDFTLGVVGYYPLVMDVVMKAVQRIFPGICCYCSERSRLPLWATGYQ